MATQEGIKVVFTGDATSLDAASKKSAQALTGVKKASGAATVALTDVSRVISDMPFGIRGVANNLEQLAGSLGRVNLKDFAKGLAGPGGMLIGLSLITSAATAAEMKYGSLSKAIEALSSGTSTAAEAQNALNKAMEEAIGSTAGEISKIQALVTIARDETLSRNARKEAIDTLNKEYDKYLPKLTQENINTQAVTQAVDKLTTSLIRQAKARGLQDLISKEAQKQAELLNNSLDQNLSTWDEIKIAAQAWNNPAKRAFLESTQGAKATGEQLDKSREKMKLFEDQLKKLLSTEAIEGTLFVDTPKIKKDLKAEVPELKLHVARVGLTFNELLLEKSTIATRFDISGLIDTGKIPAPSLPSIQLPEPDPEQIERIKTTLKDLQGFFEGVGEAITVSMGSAFSSLFESIMSGSQTAFQAFGIALGNIIKKLLATAAAAAVLTFILGPLGLVKGSSGTALRGFDLFKNLFGKIGGFAEGGVVSGPSSGYPAILHGKEVVAPFDKFVNLMQGAQNGGDGRLTLEVRGDKLLFAVNRAQRGRNLIG